MKIISCHIENFGKISNFDINFNDGINTICEENGWGKSTLASFIRVMFFGLDGDRKRSLEENERKRFAPWQGGAFGGSVTFTVHGKDYVMSRIFKDKDVNDEFELRDLNTNLISNDYSSDIGQEIFKIDRESFMNTVFIGQNCIKTSATDDINAKIGNLTEDTSDINSFETATSNLTKIVRQLNPDRSTGSINKRKSEISEYERKISSSSTLQRSIDEVSAMMAASEDKRNACKLKLKELTDKHSEVSKMQKTFANADAWEREKKNVQNKLDELDNLKGQFAGEIPDINELKRTLGLCASLNEIEGRRTSYRLSSEEKEELFAYKRSFAYDVPEESALNCNLQKAKELTELIRTRDSYMLNSEEEMRLAAFDAAFSSDTEDIATIKSKWNERTIKKNSLTAKQSSLNSMNLALEASLRSSNHIVLLVIAVIVLIAGIVCGFVMDDPKFFSISAPGLICAIVWGILFSRKNKNSKVIAYRNDIDSLELEIKDNIIYINSVDRTVMNFLRNHSKSCTEDNVSNILEIISNEALEYSMLSKRADTVAENDFDSAIGRLTGELKEYLKTYSITPNNDSILDCIYELKSSVTRYNDLLKKENSFDKADDEYEIKHAGIIDYLSRLGYTPDENIYEQLEMILTLSEQYNNAKNNLTDAQASLKSFEEENNIELLKENSNNSDVPSLDEISAMIADCTDELNEINDSILGYEKQLDGLREQFEEIEDMKTTLSELKEIQANEENQYRLIKIAIEKMTLAREIMTSKYSAPIMEGFLKYYGTVDTDRLDNFHMDANTNLTLAECGKQREIGALSYGYQDLINVSLRLALIDAMYPNEAPVIIMDDPFVNLDDAKAVAGKTMLRKVAEEYQIIYFTCSESRV